MTNPPRVLYWFRTDLRLHDSPALYAALQLNPECLYPVWFWDPHYVYRATVGPNRWKYLLDCQCDLSDNLTKLNPTSKLLVIRESPLTGMEKILKAWNISHLVFELDPDAFAVERDAQVVNIAQELGVAVIRKYGRTLWDTDEIVRMNKGQPTMTVTQLLKLGDKVGPIPRPVPTPTSLPSPGPLLRLDMHQADLSDLSAFVSFDIPPEASTVDVNQPIRNAPERSYASGIGGPKGDFAVPTLEELGIDPKSVTTPFIGGENEALEALERAMNDVAYVATFSKPASAPTAVSPPSTTLLSPHLHFGTLSVRTLFWRSQDASDEFVEAQKKGKYPKTLKVTTPPTNFAGQLYFRDMYFAAYRAIGVRFGQTHGNPRCRYIDWHLQNTIDNRTGLVVKHSGKSYDVREGDTQAEVWLERWKNGRTGFPWIDAVMIQLRTEGWIHHLARHAVACFLTRGGCYIAWERGAEVFEEWLIDHEAACNIGNWQWLSCTAFFSQYHRIYSPTAFPKKTDPEGAFVRRYLPHLSNVPAKYIYEPWTMPLATQMKSGVVIGTDYPEPMFDFAVRRQVCLEGMVQAYRLGLMGNDDRVMGGTAPNLFQKEPEKVADEHQELEGDVLEDDHEEDNNTISHAGPRLLRSYSSPLKRRAPSTGSKDRKAPRRSKTSQDPRGQSTLDMFVTKPKQ